MERRQIHTQGPVCSRVIAGAKTGEVSHFGVSNFSSTQNEILLQHLACLLVTNQIEISLSASTPLFNGTEDTLMKHTASPMAWSPLGGGKLAWGDSNVMFSKREEYQASETQLSLAWLLKHPSHIFSVIGTKKTERSIESAKAVQIKLDRRAWCEMLMAAVGTEVPYFLNQN